MSVLTGGRIGVSLFQPKNPSEAASYAISIASNMDALR